ncbi:MAG TPA: ATP-binding protein [Saprospiraceae bacterium]|nr:ATP-binding protein [Saprospiraceae bacterium]
MMSNRKKQAKLIFVTGPEASGKSSLATALGKKIPCPWVPEYAREYLAELSRPYTPEDILRIGQRQWQIQRNMQALTTAPFLICDTGFLVLKVWMEYRYGEVDPWIEEQFIQTPARHYLLCKPDIPWEPDPLREHPQQRDELYQLYLKALQDYQKPFTIIDGDDFRKRLIRARSVLQQLQ